MKNLLFVFAVLITVSSIAQNQKATLYFRDGGSVDGYATIMNSDEIKFRKGRDSQKTIYNSISIYKAVIRVNGVDTEYVYVDIADKNTTRLLEPIVKGTVTLYRDISNGYSHQPLNGVMITQAYSINSYYVSRNGEDAIHLGNNQVFSKNFKKSASNYFKDCPRLVKKIKAKELKKKDIVEVVEIYNFLCGGFQ